VFSDPIYQGLFEALMAQGKSKEEALDEVVNEIKFKIGLDIPSSQPYTDDPNTLPYAPNTAPAIQPYLQPWTICSEYDGSDNVSFGVNDEGGVQVRYTMHDGKEVSWNAGYFVR